MTVRQPSGAPAFREELLSLGEFTRVSRRTLAGGETVIVKELLGQNALTRLRHERRILERLSCVRGVPKLARGAFPAGVLAMEDCGAGPLKELVREGALEVEVLVGLAAKVARILAEVHRQGVAHKNLTPDNLLVMPGLEPLLVDFNLATTFAEERPAFVHPREITGSLPFLAPEQTGRTGRPVDQRADLYALGATLYQLATGAPPFTDHDPLQLIHDILAQVPVPPTWKSPQIPRALSDIIMRLLEKEPDRRYQSAQGVAHDLALLEERLSQGSTLELPFTLGDRDFALRLSPPSRLIGRERELATLKRVFEGALAGEGSCLLITGAAGVGKSTLVNELRPLVAARRGFFTTGKFDQYRGDLDSDGVNQALRSLGRLLLAEPEAELALFREKLRAALGPNAGLVAGLVPELALLMKCHPEPLGDDPMNVKERLVQACLAQLTAIASPGRPLVVVVDDLQWAAPTPLGLIQSMVTMKRAIPGLLIVGCFRDHGLDPGHPLAPFLSDGVKPADLPLLRLANLPPAEQGLMLGEMLRMEPEQAARLAAVVGERTGGNPYDTVEFVNALRLDGALVPGEKGWSWDAQGIRRHLGDNGVVELLDGRLKKLPARSLELLAAMACLGGEVERELLGLCVGLSLDELEERLVPPLEDGLVVPAAGGRVRFKHDRVQQAAHLTLEGEQKRLLHLSLARRLAARGGLEPLAAEQYLPALAELHDGDEKRRVVGILAAAAQRARGLNYPEADRFLEAALSLLGPAPGGGDALRVALESERLAALFCLGRLEEADLVYRRIEAFSASPLDRADAACIQICSLTSRGRAEEAVLLGVELLRELGVALPEEAVLEERTRAGLDDFYRWMERGAWRADLERPELTDRKAQAAASLMNRIIPPAYFCNQAMISWWLVTESRRLWAEHGPCAALVGPMSHLSFATISLAGEFRRGGEAVRHVLSVSEARGWEPQSSQSRFLHAMTVGPWSQPLTDNVAQSLRAEQGLVQGGDLLNASFTYYATMEQFFDSAPTLERFASELTRALTFSDRTGNSHMEGSLSPYLRLVRQLRGEEPVLRPLPDRPQPPKSGQDRTMEELCGALWSALGGDFRELAVHAARLQESFPYLQGTYAMAQAALLTALALAHQLREAAADEVPALLERLKRERGFIAGRAADAPDTFAHWLSWLDAEKAWALGERSAATGFFDRALALLQERQLPWQRALVTERAALCHLESGLSHLGGMLMAQARQHYLAWGAPGKARQLEARYPASCRGRAREQEGEQAISADAIDLLAILRASQALSSETSLERLTTLVVELLEIMTGATAVSLLVADEEGGQWRLLPGPESLSVEPVSLERAAELGVVPLSIFYYAQRTLKPLMVADATADDRFKHDPYLAGCRCCSVLAVPILNHGAPRALLLLENRLSRGAFTADLLDAVTLIAGQLAVSLENALLYERLEERVRERTGALREAQSELVAAARHAGMAEIAHNVLHNVGNVLNSVNVSAGLVSQRIRLWRVWGLSSAVELMEEHAQDLGDYLTRDSKGKLLPGYLKSLSRTLSEEQQEMAEELSRLMMSVDHIKDIVATQQCYAGTARVIEPVRVPELIEDALRMNLDLLSGHQVTVEKEFADLPQLPLDRARVLQILINLIENARQAMEAVPAGERRLTLKAELCAGKLCLSVRDRGEGIAAENLSRIFSHGFTTRATGHGFGLHASALAAREMGGTLTARSEGAGRGALFLLELPVEEGA